MKNDSHILVADDNRGVLEALELLLRRHFRQVTLIRNPAVIMSAVADGRPDVVLLDMNFTSAFNNGNEGLYWLERLRATYPQLPVVLMTAFADIPLAIKGIKAGAADFIQKPWDNDRIVEILIAAASKVRKYRDVSCCPVMYWGES
ncbi:response regulator, partial [Paramuribaculum intestinale]